MRDRAHVACCHVTTYHCASSTTNTIATLKDTRQLASSLLNVTNNCVTRPISRKNKVLSFPMDEIRDGCPFLKTAAAESCRRQLHGIKILKFYSEDAGRYDAQDKHLAKQRSLELL